MRIIAGELKGRKLHTPQWPGLRPTSDKLRETLFNVVSARVPGARVLDLYSGTGAIGLEALSRGAAHVTFVDGDRRAIALIEQNLRHCGVADRYAIIRFRLVPEAPALPAGSFDLIVLDPPYDEPDLAAALAATMPLIAPDGLVILEHTRRRPSPDRVGLLSRTREVISGDSALALYAQDRLT
jgi:16S rRNA (guanine966-N2)-methyltransferase